MGFTPLPTAAQKLSPTVARLQQARQLVSGYIQVLTVAQAL